MTLECHLQWTTDEAISLHQLTEESFTTFMKPHHFYSEQGDCFEDATTTDLADGY
jgi:hypothetical protein